MAIKEAEALNLQLSELREAWLALVAKVDMSLATQEFLRLTDLFMTVAKMRTDEPQKITE